MGIRTRGKNAVLGTLELRRGHHLHGFGDFLGILESRYLTAQTL
jgi:hypothetical protein